MTGKELCEKFEELTKSLLFSFDEPSGKVVHIHLCDPRVWDRLAEWLMESHKVILTSTQATSFTDEEIQAIRQPGSVIVIEKRCTCGAGTVKHFPDCPLA